MSALLKLAHSEQAHFTFRALHLDVVVVILSTSLFCVPVIPWGACCSQTGLLFLGSSFLPALSLGL